MADNQTMAELLQAPTEGYEDAIVILEIAANNFELKHSLIILVQNKKFFRHDKEDPHTHIRYFNKITSTMRVPNVPSSSIKLMLFPFSLEEAAHIWLEKEAPRSILTWDDLKNQSSAPAKSSTPTPVKAIEPNYVTCGALTHTKIVPLLAETFIETTSKRSGTLPSNTVTNPKEDLKRITTRSSAAYQGPQIPTQCRDQANEQIEKFYEIFKKMSFEISFTNALILMPKLASTLKALIRNKEKLCEMARTPMNEHCSAVILNKLPRKLGDPDKFLILCEFPGMDECLALAGLGASINLMPLSVWEGISLSELTSTCMTLKLADRSVSKQISIAKDVSVKVGVFHFPADFVVVDFEPYPRVPLILGSFSDVIASGNPTPYDDPIISTTLPTLTLFGDSDFLLFEEADAFLGLEDDPDSPKINPFYYDPEGDILLLEAILNSKPLPPLPNHKQYMPSYKKELKVYETKTIKSFVDEPPEIELKDLPPHLEYLFLEGDNKLPVIIAKELGDEEKSGLIKVLKSHKRAIAWKLSDIQGINLEFCTHKILMEEDYKPVVQHQRRVNPKIHNAIKKEVEKLLDAGLIYPISDSLWVCIDYHKLNEATRKDHFPLPSMDQMLERLARNEYYCFLNGFSGYFQIPIDPRDEEKTMFTCPYGTFAYRRMPFGLCNAPSTFQRCMLAIFHDMVEKTMEVFMDDFSVFGNSFENCLSYLDKMLQRAKFDVIAKLPHPITVKGIRSFLDHVGFYRLYRSFPNVKEKLTEAPILIAPNWDLPFELMCDASDFTIGTVLGQRHEKHFKPIHHANKIMNDAESNYTTSEKEMLAVVYAFKKFRSYLIMNKSIVHTDHSALKYLFAKKDANARLLRAMWFADFANYHVGNFIVKDQVIRRCVHIKEPLDIIVACHNGPTRGHHGANLTAKKIFDFAFFWPTIYKDTHNFVKNSVVGDHQKVQLNELNELRDHAYENSLIYKEKMKRIHDSKIKNRVFNIGDRVLLFNSRLKIFSGKLKTRWSGPFTIAKVFPYGTVELSQANGPNFKVNGHRVKHYFGGDVPQLVVSDLQTFPMDN
uniref:RNA-directed DNA polymerase n=1 Tax=Tanacetum cinerariifolium TaxID=118510 RepID=A0A6L2J4T1_TANCI|nr:hypothetical protein [Tanacetum cinerariifolium]